MDPGLNNLLKWGIQNSEAAQDPNAQNGNQEPRDPSRGLNPELLAQLMGGPSDADLMKEAMAAIVSAEVDLENKLVAFDNLEQLVEGIDNANNMENLGLWAPLVQQLEHEEAELRRMAAWCIGTAVQNNVKAQERVLALDTIPKLIHLALHDPHEGVRKKAIYALSSEIRNYQPAIDVAKRKLPGEMVEDDYLDSGDMESIDTIMNKLRERSSQH